MLLTHGKFAGVYIPGWSTLTDALDSAIGSTSRKRNMPMAHRLWGDGSRRDFARTIDEQINVTTQPQ